VPKKGIYYLLKTRNDLSITPVLMHGLGRALPRGEALLVLFNCDVIVGDKLPTAKNPDELVQYLSDTYEDLLQYCLTYNTLE